MDIFLQQILNGLVLGSIYALIALGYTMVYGVLGIINFAHGEVLMLGAMIALTCMQVLQYFFPELPVIITILIVLVVSISSCAVISFYIEKLAYRPLRFAPRLAPLISAIGMSILLQTIAMMIWGRTPLRFPQLLPTQAIQIPYSTATITTKEIIIIVVSLIVMLTLLVLVKKTKFGRAIRATSENPSVAGLMGVNTDRVISYTFMLGGGLAALAGFMIASNYGSAHFYMGFTPGLKAFTAAVLGGIGNIPGAMLGGLLLGLIESLGSGYISELSGGVFGSNYQDIFAFLVLIIVLIFRPSGLLGEKQGDRA
ncbi:branched-chain amino acid ABC transporter permease [Polynucleobacter sp. SHI8]|uniref:branched-chain amino acid ABC transporter permease n=1 Tax=unclassified Polynucleobacter TaxID=2640945 RepID=UPI0024928816|nr:MULTISPECIES: branched-chain amino acid ABC transporter permease [unclassified Polynucleobacter]BDW11914.1 branched-chain amino acid ABC transporter permease [Polynucleobacter sp. SHI2]BDW14361.1 branched-chain amino acid ABC transporter permease [Polynucleobacter sp. SHI8]